MSVTVADLQVVVDRGRKIQRIREYDVDRNTILNKAITDAVVSGYVFDDTMSNKVKDQEFRKQWLKKHGHVAPTRGEWKRMVNRG